MSAVYGHIRPINQPPTPDKSALFRALTVTFAYTVRPFLGRWWVNAMKVIKYGRGLALSSAVVLFLSYSIFKPTSPKSHRKYTMVSSGSFSGVKLSICRRKSFGSPLGAYPTYMVASTVPKLVISNKSFIFAYLNIIVDAADTTQPEEGEVIGTAGHSAAAEY